MRCPICNSENPANARFCANCGNRLPERRQTESERRVATVLFGIAVSLRPRGLEEHFLARSEVRAVLDPVRVP